MFTPTDALVFPGKQRKLDQLPVLSGMSEAANTDSPLTAFFISHFCQSLINLDQNCNFPRSVLDLNRRSHSGSKCFFNIKLIFLLQVLWLMEATKLANLPQGLALMVITGLGDSTIGTGREFKLNWDFVEYQQSTLSFLPYSFL